MGIQQNPNQTRVSNLSLLVIYIEIQYLKLYKILARLTSTPLANEYFRKA